MTSEKPLRIAIVGSGIAGITSAIAIQHYQGLGANVQLKLYEQAPEFKEIGAGIGFGHNSRRILENIGLRDIVHRLGNNPSVESDVWINFGVGEADSPIVGQTIYTVRGPGASQGGMHRADFLDETVKFLKPGVATFNYTCTSYTPHESGITLHFEGRSDEEADIVLACDGVKSRLRRHLYTRKGLDVEDQIARYSKWVVWRGLIPIEVFKEAMGADCPTPQLLMGEGRHMLHFPVRNGKLVNIVGFVLDEDNAKLGNHTGPWAESRDKAEALEDFKSFMPGVLKMIAAIPDPSIWGIFTCPQIATAIDERLALIGDSHVAMTPHQGSGGGMAVEDAMYIASLLCNDKVAKASQEDRPKKIRTVLELYQKERHSRASKVQKTSYEAGMLYEFKGVNGEGRDLDKIIEALKTRMNWIWLYDIMPDIQKAIESL